MLAFDVGGTRIKAGLVHAGSPEVIEVRTADVGPTFGETLKIVRVLGREIIDGRSLEGVGLCLPGLVDERGVVISLPGKLEGVVGFDLPGFLTTEFHRNWVVVNDAVAYAIGEAAAGAGAGMGRVVVMTIGTGVGVLVVEGGHPVGGGPLGGGLLGGHIPISERADGLLDTNRRPDTIEALCSARRIVDYSNEAGGSFSSVEGVYEALDRRDPAALRGIEVFKEHLVRALVALAHAHAPAAIVVGGGPITDATPLLSGLEELVDERLFGSYRVEIKRAQLGDAAGLIGLARLLEQGPPS